MVFVLVIYVALVYLLFFKFKWLPWNAPTQVVTLLLGVMLLLGFLVGITILTPVSSQAVIATRIVEISPLVSGRVNSVSAQRNVEVEAGAVLFTIDPTQYQARVDQLEAQLALSRLRLEQFETLAETGAESRFQLEQTQAEVKQLKAQLAGARFDLDNTVIRAPSKGMVPRLQLKNGARVAPLKSVMAFMDTSELLVGGLFQQKALQHAKIGDKVTVNFPALPGRVFDSEVAAIPSAIGDGQLTVSGKLSSVQGQHMVLVYPIYAKLPEDFPEHLKKPGLAAQFYIHTEGAGPISAVAKAMQWMTTSLDAVL